MSPIEAAQQLEELQPVPPPPPGPTYDRMFGNQIRWTMKVIGYWRYQRTVRRLEAAIR
jgi:hypothetical protein